MEGVFYVVMFHKKRENILKSEMPTMHFAVVQMDGTFYVVMFCREWSKEKCWERGGCFALHCAQHPQAHFQNNRPSWPFISHVKVKPNKPLPLSHLEITQWQRATCELMAFNQKLGLLAHVKRRVSLQPWNLLGVILMVDLATPFLERNNILGGFLLVCNSSSCAHKWQNNWVLIIMEVVHYLL